MNLSDLNDLLLTAIVTYGASALALVFFLAALGLPLPSTLCVVAGGAFIQQGVLDLPTTFVLAAIGVLLGDTLSYGMGRVLRGPIERRYSQSPLWLRAESYFAKRGALAIFLTRCVLTPIALPTNLVAGSSGYPLMRFVSYDALGELVWLLCYGALGYLFGSQWEYVSDFLSNASGLLVGLLIVCVGLYWLVRWQRQPAPLPQAADGAALLQTDASDITK